MVNRWKKGFSVNKFYEIFLILIITLTLSIVFESSLPAIADATTVHINVPLYSQRDNIISWDCLLVSAKMVIDYYGDDIMNRYQHNNVSISSYDEYRLAREFKPDICIQSPHNCDYNDYKDTCDLYGSCTQGSHGANFNRFLNEKLGLPTAYYYSHTLPIAESIEILKKHLRNYRPVIVHVPGHYFVVTGFNDFAEEFYANDPGRSFQRTISYNDFYSWDGRMLIMLPPIYRIYIKMKANYDSNDENGWGLYMYATNYYKNKRGDLRWLNIFTTNANDGNWHTYYWNLSEEVADFLPGNNNRVRVAMTGYADRSKWVYVDYIKVKRFENGLWTTRGSTHSVFSSTGQCFCTWCLTYYYNAGHGIFRSFITQPYNIP